MTNLPAWQLPQGVSRGTWDYVQSESIAADYDHYFKGDRLMLLDEQIVLRFLPPKPMNSEQEAPVVADFGCGTGRVGRLLLPLGYRVLNFDLSLPMLRSANRDANDLSPEGQKTGNRAACVQVNLALLDCLRAESIDFGVCLYSSLGMIRGRKHRLSFLRAARRCLKANAQLLVHVHNRYSQCYKSAQLAWLSRSRFRSWYSNHEFGDRVYTYRGLPRMFLHIFSQREMIRDLRAAGFAEIDVLPIDATSSQLLSKSTWFTDVRAGGFFVTGKRCAD